MKKQQDNNNPKQKGMGFFENLQPNQLFNSEKHRAQKERKVREEERRFFERKRIQEKTVWTAEQQKTNLQIKAIQEELSKLVNEIGSLGREVKTAATQAIVEPGVYHLNFLGKLREHIKLLRRKVQESRSWLATWNTYCKRKRNHYWLQVKKSGTKFMLSSERYMATQAG